MGRYILSIDQGTTGSTASLVDENGVFLEKVNEEFEQIYPKPGWVEHNPKDILKSVSSTITGVFEKTGVKRHDVVGIGITNQRETVVIWDRKTGEPVYNAIVWQCRRTSDFCRKLNTKPNQNLIKKKTGLVIDPYFSASKIRWILDNVDGVKKKAKAGELAFGTIDTFILWHLTGGEVHKTDVSNASRTQLMNINTGKWDKDLLDLFKVPESLLPEIEPSSRVYGVTHNFLGLPDGIPVSGMAGDQQSALFGQVCFDVGQAKCTYGTGSFILMNTGTSKVQSKSGLLTTVAWQLEGEKKLKYALEGGAFICGAAVQWLRDELKFFNSSAEIEELASQVEDTGGVEFVPALSGLGAPYWDSEARGLICGLTRGSNRNHIARATLEAMALQNADILLSMEKDLGKKLKGLRVDGGASSNNLLMQMQANFLGTKITRPAVLETTSAGAAYLAGLGVKLWPDLETIKKVWRVENEFKSEWTKKKRENRLESWHQAIHRTLGKKVIK